MTSELSAHGPAHTHHLEGDDIAVHVQRGDRLCLCCQTWVRARRPSILWWIPMIAAFLGLIASGVVISVMPPLNIVGIPVFFLLGSSLMGYLGDKVGAPSICPSCGKAMD